MHNTKERDWAQELIDQCTGCGACAKNCLLLTEIDEEPCSIAARGATVEEAFGCGLCGMCEAVCPLGLSPFQMFQQKRNQAVADGEIDIDEYRYMFPDRPLNVMSFFREYYGIDYSDLNLSTPSDTGFFPGCTMMSYSPELTRTVFNKTAESHAKPVFFTDCCAKPLYQMGLPDRGEKSRERLREKMKKLEIKRLIVVCPNCFYELKKALKGMDIELVTVYEMLMEQGCISPKNPFLCTVHDSCPDRFDQVFNTQVRQALKDAGGQVVEMKHRGKRAICCGSGGQLGHFRPDFGEKLVEQRFIEAKKSGAEILVGYCHSCVLHLGQMPEITVRHALNILLDFEEDYAGVQNKAGQMFQGPDGADNWLKIMNE